MTLQEASELTWLDPQDQIAVSVRVLPGGRLQITENNSLIIDSARFEKLISKNNMISTLDYSRRNNTVLAYKQKNRYTYIIPTTSAK